ncbi:MAG TPA: NAD(P)-dependent oxidoreductase, partial [Gammaproteobacteria bacterium]|nr:NAD(P)-dependent oxidoreductase [Gammaproteobacteria bacterium]
MRFHRLVFLDLATVDRGDLDLSPIVSRTREFLPWPATAPDEVAGHVAAADAIVLNKVRLGAEVFERVQPRIVCLAATGTDNVDLVAAREAGIAVANIRDYCTDSVVQHVFALLLALSTRLAEHREHLQTGAWPPGGAYTLPDLPIRELGGKTLAVVGFGTLGRAVA